MADLNRHTTATLTLDTAHTDAIRSWTSQILYAIGYPIALALYYLAIFLLFLAKQLYRPVAFLLQPVVYLGRFVLVCIGAPFRLLVKFETLYIYLGVAALVGIIGGVLVGYIYRALHSVLQLDSSAATTVKGGGGASRTAKEYRETKQKQKFKVEAPLLSPGVLSPSSRLLSPDNKLSLSDGTRRARRTGRGLSYQTIMEEVDSDS